MLRSYQQTWLAKFGPLALANERRYGVPHIFTLAQQLVESAWSLNKLGNNFFGIKADGSWQGPANLQKTHEYTPAGQLYNTTDHFRAYATPAAAYEGHAQFLRTQPRYRLAFQTKDPVAFAKAIADARYATDPDYFNKLRTNIYFLQGRTIPVPVAGAGIVLAALGLWVLSRNR